MKIDGTVIRSITFPNHFGVMISMDADYSRVMEYTGLRDTTPKFRATVNLQV